MNPDDRQVPSSCEKSTCGLCLKNRFLDKLVAIVLLSVCIALIFPSGFRGEMGADTITYRGNYEATTSEDPFLHFFSIYNYEPGTSVFLMSLKKIGLNTDEALGFLMFFSMSCLIYIFFKAIYINFIVFSLLYLDFLYYQLQWSTLRNLLGFWIFSVLLVNSRNTIFTAFAASSFHYSFLVGLIKPYAHLNLISLSFSIFIVYYFIDKYSSLSYEILYEFFWGGWVRFIYNIFSAGLILFLMGFLNSKMIPKIKEQPQLLLFGITFLLASVFPLGWRVMAVFIPFLLISDLQYIPKRNLYFLTIFCCILFLLKSISFTQNQLVYGEESIVGYLLEYYFSF